LLPLFLQVGLHLRVKPPMSRVIVFIAAMVGISTSMAAAAEFDCNPSSTSGLCPKAVICGVSVLWELDGKVENTYHRLLSQRTGASAELLKSDQRAWLELRNACACDAACLEREYQRRATELERIDRKP
jgi:uncharacterized protein